MPKKSTKLPVPKPSAKQQAASAARAKSKLPKLSVSQKLESTIAKASTAIPTIKNVAQAKAVVAELKGHKTVRKPPVASLLDMAKSLTGNDDPGDLPEFLRRSLKEKPAQVRQPVSRETSRETSLTVNPAAKQALRAEAIKAVAENPDKIVQVPAKSSRMPQDKPKLIEAMTKAAKAQNRSTGKYDWRKAEAMVKAGKLPPVPRFASYGPHMQAVHDYAHKGDLTALTTYMGNFKDEQGGRANLFRYARLCGYKS